jgi:Sec-independent protein secretion pathway component TatC
LPGKFYPIRQQASPPAVAPLKLSAPDFRGTRPPGFAKAMRPKSHDFSDDLFADTRMTFGDHLEELRTRMWRALKGMLFCLIIAFVLDGVGSSMKWNVHHYLPFSIGLFLAGIFLCFSWVLPGAVRALLAFNDWLGVDPDIRLNEWLTLAIILPLVFGISFQTPLVMLFLNRLGMFHWQDYLSKWRIAMFVLACFAAVITPTPDAVTMLYLFVPMFGLYLFGILLCRWMPPPFLEGEETGDAEEVAV